MRIVIAYDGSDSAIGAVDDLRRSGLPREADAMVVSVGETLLPMPLTASAGFDEGITSHRVAGTLLQAPAETVQAEARELAHEASQRVLAHFPHWGIRTEPMVGAPAQAVLQKAADWRADLIVVGSHGRSALARFVLGSVSKQVAKDSRCSVRVARHVVERGAAPVRIIVGVDGSRGAEAAVQAVALRTWPEKTEVRLITVGKPARLNDTRELPPLAGAWVRTRNEEQIAKSRAMLEQAADALRGAGLQVSPDTTEGSPQDILSEEARTWNADCIFVGACGFDSVPERFAIGGVATALVMSAPCSVEIARRAREP